MKKPTKKQIMNSWEKVLDGLKVRFRNNSGSVMSFNDYIKAEFLIKPEHKLEHKAVPNQNEEGYPISFFINWNNVRTNSLSIFIQQLGTIDWERCNACSPEEQEEIFRGLIGRSAFGGFGLENTICLMKGEHDMEVSRSISQQNKKRK